jgi:hypothetical protein
LGTYRGEPPVYQNAAATSYAENIVRVYNEFREVDLKLKPGAKSSSVSVARGRSPKCPKLAWLAGRRVKVSRGHRARVRIRFSRATVRAIVRCAGPRASCASSTAEEVLHGVSSTVVRAPSPHGATPAPAG